MWNVFDVIVIGSAFFISIAEVIRQVKKKLFSSEATLNSQVFPYVTLWGEM